MSKKKVLIINIIVLFLAICIGTIAYIYVINSPIPKQSACFDISNNKDLNCVASTVLTGGLNLFLSLDFTREYAILFLQCVVPIAVILFLINIFLLIKKSVKYVKLFLIINFLLSTLGLFYVLFQGYYNFSDLNKEYVIIIYIFSLLYLVSYVFGVYLFFNYKRFWLNTLILNENL